MYPPPSPPPHITFPSSLHRSHPDPPYKINPPPFALSNAPSIHLPICSALLPISVLHLGSSGDRSHKGIWCTVLHVNWIIGFGRIMRGGSQEEREERKEGRWHQGKERNTLERWEYWKRQEKSKIYACSHTHKGMWWNVNAQKERHVDPSSATHPPLLFRWRRANHHANEFIPNGD